jgi:hypothetical protein
MSIPLGASVAAWAYRQFITKPPNEQPAVEAGGHVRMERNNVLPFVSHSIIDPAVPRPDGFVTRLARPRPIQGEVYNQARADDQWTPDMLAKQEAWDVYRHSYKYPTYSESEPLQLGVMSLKKLLPVQQPYRYYEQNDGPRLLVNHGALRLTKRPHEV